MEITERKGLGHPDTICDSIMDYESVKYSQMALKVFGFIPHHNLDKALLCAGRSRPKFGGGKIVKQGYTKCRRTICGFREIHVGHWKGMGNK
jgi:S-adenosylmethionine synthetase